MTRLPITAHPLLNGSTLPAITLQDHEGKLYNLLDFVGTKGMVVAFIHGTWCPFCIRQLIRLDLVAPELQSLDVGLVCIANESAESYSQGAPMPLRYPLLPDAAPSVAHQFGIYDPDHESPYPAIFYADQEGKVLYTDVSSDPDCYPNMERLLEVIQYGIKGKPDEPPPTSTASGGG
jgi:peroxiredoxin Q/BCP